MGGSSAAAAAAHAPSRTASSRTAAPDPAIVRARRIADVMDRKLVDPVLGFLLPGVGDLISSLLGLYVVGIAVDRGLPAVVVARMLINLGLDATVGAIPIAGDLFDLGFKAHTRNLELLEQRRAVGGARSGDWAYVGAAVFALIVAIAVPVLLVVGLVRWVF